MRVLFALIVCIAAVGFTMITKKKVIFFGDSITDAGAKPGGYIPRVAELAGKEKPGDQFDFIGSGIGGNKIYDFYLRMDEDVLAKSPDVVVIYEGVNDVWHKSSLGTGTDVDKYERFYLAVVKKFKDKNVQVVLCTPAVIGEKTDFTNEQDGDMNRYSEIIRSIAKKNNLPLVDLRKAFLDYNKKNNPSNNESGILTTDRVHLNDAGNQLVADEMWKVLKGL